MELPTLDEPENYFRACDLAADLDHHVFDTLYHAVALSLADGRLVTADERYWRKARRIGQIERLRDYRLAV
jgi:predicted nucleic acid-binding protein